MRKVYRRKKVIRIIGIILLVYIVYMILGALLPFINAKDVSQDFKNSFDITSFFGKEAEGVDRAAVVESSQDALDIRLQMLNDAKERIILSSFSIKNDRSCQEIFSVILAAAERGVEVQIIGDGISCAIDMKSDPMYYLMGTHPNVEIRFYNMLNLAAPWNLNGRLHDKYVIVDDRLLLLGGRNTSDYFLGEYNTDVLSYDRDMLVYNTMSGTKRNEESVIKQTEDYFYSLWNSSDTVRVFHRIPMWKDERVEKAEENLKAIYKKLLAERPELFPEETDYQAMTVPTQKITLIYNPIHLTAKEPWLWYQLSELMLQAKERVYIQTPYAVLNQSMYQVLADISDNGVDSRILLNSIAAGDNFMASSDYKLNRKKVLETGIKIYEFQGKHSLHNKSALIDDDISMVGSFNLDMRSTYLDTETALIVHGKEFNRVLEEAIMNMEQEALLVKEDGTYEQSDTVTPVELPYVEKMIFSVTSVVFQLFRCLL